jgi:putative membrane protein
MKRLLIVFGLLTLASPASAHGFGEAWSSEATWTADPLILAPLYILAVVFLAGAIRLWRHAGIGRGTRLWQVGCFWVGWTVLALALLSPLHWLSEHLLSAHMVEHELIMAVAAPLLVLSRPLGVFVWAIPQAWRVAFAQVLVIPTLGFGSEPLAATALHSATIWAWHLPPLFDAALANRWVHMAQHVSFLATALLFWWAVLNVPLARRGAAALHLFATMLALTFLGALMTLSSHPLYASYQGHQISQLSPLEDQQLAGLIMWVPGCAIYAVAALTLLGQWISKSDFSRPRITTLVFAAKRGCVDL